MNKPEGTEEERKRILDNDFSNLLGYIDNELAEFYSLFTSAYWTKKDGCSFLNLNIEHNGVDTLESVQINITFKQFFYRINVTWFNNEYKESKIYEKEYSYSESTTEQDKTDIINAIGNQLNQFIEKNKC